ncbi:hypothetical protein ASPFODRAFT_474633 [Aspergillus luchuensis CBS 106.47]|uniref:Uncharacterized protein n=1 Tax=Aspergillus luchuensis (strain CBS 106.47) TaxID=1137211 RepID=A0A1M3TQ38_ASPLC|nr:hypothetical protein ASPFODRAFT_474633 [Aspergillus luchuensis CBS 106.47]
MYLYLGLSPLAPPILDTTLGYVENKEGPSCETRSRTGGVSLVFRSGYLHGDHREGKQREIAMTGEREMCLVGITTMCGVGFGF